MTPHRDRGTGTYILDRVVRGVGRIKLASGTTHRPTFQLLNDMITGLYQRGRLDLLAALRDRILTPLQVWDAYRVNELERLPTAAMLVPLADAFTSWRDGAKASAWHQASRAQSGRYLEQHARKDSRVAELPAILLEARKAMEARGHAVSFNRLKSAAQAFVRDRLGKAHSLYREVQGVPRLAEVAKVDRRPQTVAQLATIAATLDEATRAAVWSMATTGMGPGEYWGTWERRVGFIHIAGTKREGRVRDVPDLGRCSPPALSRQALEDRLVKAGAPFRPYDARRTFANWLEAAQIPRTRRRLTWVTAPATSRRCTSSTRCWRSWRPTARSCARSSPRSSPRARPGCASSARRNDARRPTVSPTGRPPKRREAQRRKSLRLTVCAV